MLEREERLLRLARKAARLLEKPVEDIDARLSSLGEFSVSREEACEVARRVRGLVEAYRPLEEGSLQPSSAYLSLKPVYELFKRICSGGHVEERYVAIALAVLGLLEAGKTSRAAALASILQHVISSRGV